MTHTKIKELLNSAITVVSSSVSDYVENPDKDFSRSRKLPADKLMSFLIAEGSSTTKNELLDFFGMDKQSPSSSAFFQQREKLKPEALKEVFDNFTGSVSSCADKHPGYRLIAADGSTASYFSRDKYSPPDEYFISPGNSSKGAYSIHINAFQDLDSHLYTDALLQPVHHKDEFRAFCTIVDRHPVVPGSKNIYIGDRGYCSYNNMAHVIQNEQYFLFRTKDIHQKGLVGKFDFPDEETFDITVNVTLVRSHSRKIDCGDTYRRFIDAATSFDYLEYGSKGTYPISFRVVRVELSDSSYECLVTNLPADEFPPGRLKKLYYARWGIESSFRKLKYTIGLSNFHSYKPKLIMQEIWARLTAYNLTEAMINNTVIKKAKRRHSYKVNFSVAAHICRAFLRPSAEENLIDVMVLLARELIPIRENRKYNRLQTAHFRRPRYFIYRAA